MSRFAVLYSDDLKEYDLGHVLTQDRYQDFIDMFRDSLGAHPAFDLVAPTPASHRELRLIHTEAYIQRIDRCESRDPFDTPLSPGLVRAAKLLAGAGRTAGELVQSGAYLKAFVVGGGVQHANRQRERGFGVFSDVGICAENLMQNFGVSRILIIDTDAHAGEGLYDIFCCDSRVLLISLHQDPRTVYPGRGFVEEIGEAGGRGYSVNIPLMPGSTQRAYELILTEVFMPLVREFQPEIILMVDGADPHFTDRITQMGLTLEGIRTVGRIISRAADEICGGKLVDFVGSGYSANPRVVSLGWLASMSGVTGVDVELAEPEALPAGLDAADELAAAERVTAAIRARLAAYWNCFR
jgi:acetoin utilization protein AcuC